MVTRQADKRANLVNENLLEEIVTSGRNAVPSTAFTQAQTRNEVNQKTKWSDPEQHARWSFHLADGQTTRKLLVRTAAKPQLNSIKRIDLIQVKSIQIDPN